MNLRSSIIFLLLDFIWILNNRAVYNNLALSIQKENINMNYLKILSFFITYFFLLYGLNKIVIPYNNPFEFGMIVYGVYSFTNFILFNNYSFKLAIIDTIWGMLLYYFSINL